MTVLIEVKHLSRYYAQHCAVNDISFTLSQGEILGFLGPNGAGKTTTMQMLAGNLAPNEGSIKIGGINLLEQPLAAKRSLGYLPDTLPLYKELTVNEYLCYCATLHHVPKSQINAAVQTAKQRCGLEQVGERLIQNLSKGFQQRVGIAQAIVHNPPVIILDEPTVGLDPLQIREIRNLIRELGKEHGILLSTHILSEVQESCTHVQIIQQGSLILKKSIGELNQLMQSSILQIKTRKPLDPERLKQIPGVSTIESLTDTQIKLSYTSFDSAMSQTSSNQDAFATTLIETVAETIVHSGCGLLELTPVQYSLEDLFVQMMGNRSNLLERTH